MRLSACIHQFFDHYLPRLKGVSEHTVCAYRDTFTLFLPFAASYHSINIDSLTIDHLSFDLILAFLHYLKTQRNNIARTRNLRLAALKSFAKMIRLMYPEEKKIAEKILNIPQKRTQKPLIGFLSQEEILKVYQVVDIKKNDGFRDYTLLHLLADSGARASEIATLNLDYFDFQKKTLSIVGKGNRYRLIELWPKTTELIKLYITQYRNQPKPLYRNRLFINQRGEELTRYGIYRLCKKYLTMALSAKHLKGLNPAHSFRHACAVNMLQEGCSLTEIQNRLGHENIESTMIYLKLNISRRRNIQKKFIDYTQSFLKFDPKIEELLDWENKEKTLDWLDNL
jgi:site-specific recombinase XerD